MAVKMLTGIAGDGWAKSPGEILESDAAHEARLVAAGLAEAVEAPKPEPKAKGKK